MINPQPSGRLCQGADEPEIGRCGGVVQIPLRIH
jgi:hypothetical protein